MEEIISRDTRNAFGTLIQSTHSFAAWPLLGMMREAGITCTVVQSDQGTKEAYYRGIDWRRADSVLRILPFFEEAYRRSSRVPKLTRLKHEMKLKDAMARDRLSFDDEGHIVRADLYARAQ